jgi:hypothetical protein
MSHTQNKSNYTQEVKTWLIANGVPSDNNILYNAFPHISKPTLTKIKSRFLDTFNPNSNNKPRKKKVIRDNKNDIHTNSNTENDDINTTNNSTDIIDKDLKEDIKRIKYVMNSFGEGVRLNEVVSFMKEMNSLKPSKDELIQHTLKDLSVDELEHIILGTQYIPNQTFESTLDKNIITSLIEESDL